MQNFELFDQFKNIDTMNNAAPKCTHPDLVVEDKRIFICMACGEEVRKEVGHNKEWRVYNRHGFRKDNPARVQARKQEDKNILNDVSNMGLSESIINKANELYSEATKGKIFRGKSRKAIVFACVFNSYKIMGNPQSYKKLKHIFKIDKKSCLKGLKHVSLNCELENDHYITPEVLIKEIMEKLLATPEQIEEVEQLHALIKNKSSKLNRSRPQSIASALVFYWIKKNNKGISIKQFSKEAELSELTINKIVAEIDRVLQ